MSKYFLLKKKTFIMVPVSQTILSYNNLVNFWIKSPSLILQMKNMKIQEAQFCWFVVFIFPSPEIYDHVLFFIY